VISLKNDSEDQIAAMPDSSIDLFNKAVVN